MGSIKLLVLRVMYNSSKKIHPYQHVFLQSSDYSDLSSSAMSMHTEAVSRAGNWTDMTPRFLQNHFCNSCKVE